MTTVREILDELHLAAWDKRDKGTRFERLTQSFLKTDPTYVAKYDEVWMWHEWPGCDGRQETGIDLVARERDTGDLCAIQCKFYDPHEYLLKGEIDSFFTESGKEPFRSRIVVSTTDNWSKNAEDALHNQQIPVARIGVSDFENSGVDWSQFSLVRNEGLRRREPKKLRPHQETALEDVVVGLAAADRGKLIMACGTGKTFTALRTAERLVPAGGSILFLVPSISLLSQALKEWSTDALVPLRTFAVCSDVRAGKRTEKEDIGSYDLAFPATTNTAKLVRQIGAGDRHDAITVVFSTYQSIDVVAEAQREGLPTFDLVICDEAHRTTGVTLAEAEESAFVRVHDDDFIRAVKRLYMTATPRVYSDVAQSKAKEVDAQVVSMDDERHFGKELHRLGFGEAVGKDLLTDYRVLVLAVDETYVSRIFQNQLADKDHELQLGDAPKIVGCWNGLAKRGTDQSQFLSDSEPMKRAVAFSRSIKDSERFRDLFTEIVADYTRMTGEEEILQSEVRHVDGGMNALKRSEELDWLKEEPQAGECRVLSNARCLSEGVDVPALDAVMFLNPRKSQVDVIQAVGRVMRLAPEKRYGYVILPIGVPAGVTPEEALRDNEKYRVVWQVLQALRSHDDRLNAVVNRIEVATVTGKDDSIGKPGREPSEDGSAPTNTQLALTFPDVDEWRQAIFAKAVEKVGERIYWERWAADVTDIAARHTARIQALLRGDDPDLREVFDNFLDGLRRNLNDGVTEVQAIEMLSQHSVTRPVFDALFDNYDFAERNPVSIVMQEVLDVLDRANVSLESESLEPFYDSVRRRAAGIDSTVDKQGLVVQLYERFFKLAFPKMSESLGIVYTPAEIVDFILNSTERVLQEHFGASISDRDVHVLDPFTGTGTFITRLLGSGLISPDDLVRKYRQELHANEIVLLAYYVAAINIEATFHGAHGGEYEPFEGIVLTDTFQSSEEDDRMDVGVFPQNNDRLLRQKRADITVIVGNPPYSVGQGSQNDDNQNLAYPTLDGRIEQTYAARSSAGLKRNLYDSYVRAFRWASDRIGVRGVVAFVSNGSYIDTGSFDGFRRTLAEEFSAVYCLNLRGNARTQGEQRRKEKDSVFGQGSRTPVAITLLVKDPTNSAPAAIYYHDVGDYLARDEKLAAVYAAGDLGGVPWDVLAPNDAADWINLRDETFATFAPLGAKKGDTMPSIFDLYSLGVVTNRDAWAYNSSRDELLSNMGRMIETYNAQIDGYAKWLQETGGQRSEATVDRYIDRDPMHVSWTRGLKSELRKGKRADFRESAAVPSMYRPYFKQWLYFDRQLNEMVLQVPRIFPTPAHKNLVISLNASDARKPFGAIVTDVVPNLALSDPGQCFPLYRYEAVEDRGLFTDTDAVDGYVRRDAITNQTLENYQKRYGGELSKEDIFFYVYGVLHSPEYRRRFAADLKKMIPRIPMVPDFQGFSRAGRALAKWHLDYESVEPWPLVGLPELGTASDLLRVEKMRFANRSKTKDRSTIVVNQHVTLSDIPEEAYRYEVNGKSAIEWLMDRYETKVDKASGIRNDPNTWSDDPRYIVDLVARMVRVSVESVTIISSLSPLGI